ncbi:MAG: hypothetical protein AAF485_28545 [Chloroflexota bacterium]
MSGTFRRVLLFCGIGIALFSLFSLLCLFFVFPSNSHDNQNPVKRTEMMVLTREWGRLAPFPVGEEAVSIQTEGTLFTRSFRATFNASDEAINRWIEESPGLKSAEIEEIEGKKTYFISPGGGANYAEVVIESNPNDISQVDIYVSWS